MESTKQGARYGQSFLVPLKKRTKVLIAPEKVEMLELNFYETES